MRKSIKMMAALVFSAATVAICVPQLAEKNNTAYAAEQTSVTKVTDEDLSKSAERILDYSVSVHDPSVVQDTESGRYYIFGSHRAYAYSDDLVSWTYFRNNLNGITKLNYDNVLPEDVVAWSRAGDSVYNIEGNLWAPDVIWNEKLGKWCMYLSVNGCSWNSSIIMLTSDSLKGDWTYVDTIIYSGFTDSGSHSYEKTDYKEVTGDTTLPERYKRNAYTCYDGGVKTEPTTWNEGYGAHAIDPCVFYDEAGKLWMTYGSWSGGIYIIELDENTGLRDKTVKYELIPNESDPYMGKKLGGGERKTGEASYVQYIDGYYYLWITYGGLTSTGGYNMHVFRSENPDGPYRDISWDDARNNNRDFMCNVGTKMMTYYRWDWMSQGQIAQGHNSAIVAPDGNAYVVYHTRTTGGGETHYVRTHQLFTTKNGYLVAAPFQYHTTDTTSYDDSDIAGTYKIIMNSATQFDKKKVNQTKNITLHKDGTITGYYKGTWEKDKDGNYLTLVLGGVTYEGVMVVQTLEDVNSKVEDYGIKRYQDDIKALCFTVAGKNDIAIFGEKPLGKEAIAYDKRFVAGLPSEISSDIKLPVLGRVGCDISWSSDNEAVLSSEGKYTKPDKDTKVTMTMKMTAGKYQYTKKYSVLVKGHSYTVTKKVKATDKMDGYTMKVCKICGDEKQSTKKVIKAIKSVKLSKTSFEYDGKKHIPNITIKDKTGKKLIEGTDYKVEWKNTGKKAGVYSGTVTFKGNYSGKKEISYIIKPASTKLKSVTPAKNQLVIKWNKQMTQTSGYKIQVATNSSFTKNVKKIGVKGSDTANTIITGLKSGKRYYVRVRAYKADSATGMEVYSSWSKAKTAVVK